MSTEPILDPGAIERLEDWGGPILKVKMIDLFLANGPERMAGLREGLASDDLELAERSAHSLKSSAGNLGAQAVRALCATIEGALEDGDDQTARGLLPQLEERFEKTIDALTHARTEESE